MCQEQPQINLPAHTQIEYCRVSIYYRVQIRSDQQTRPQIRPDKQTRPQIRPYQQTGPRVEECEIGSEGQVSVSEKAKRCESRCESGD